MPNEFTLVAPCFFGTESTLSFEVRRLGAQNVQVKVLSIAPDGKIALSIKRTQPAPERGNRQGGGQRPAQQQRPKREEKPRVWQPKPPAPQGEMSFEDMMARYKSRSEEKIADLKRVTENHRGGYSRRRG